MLNVNTTKITNPAGITWSDHWKRPIKLKLKVGR